MRALALLLSLRGSFGCSYVEVPYPSESKTSYLIARTMELSNLFNSTSYVIQSFPRSEGRLGFVAPVNVFEMPRRMRIAFEGMNEKGLTVSANYFQQSEYETVRQGQRAIKSEDLVAELLASCGDVEEVKAMLAQVAVVQSLVPCHWAVADASGRSIVVEYLQGRRVVYENTARLMTNDPELPWHWRNLNQHVHLSASYPYQNDVLQVEVPEVGMVPKPVGHGLNLVGLPGDSSSASRFVRLFYMRGYATQAQRCQSLEDAMVLGTGLLNTVFIPFGPVAGDSRSPGDGPEMTDYAVLKAPSERLLVLRGYRNSRWRSIDLTKLDWSRERTWPLEDGTLGVEDITFQGHELAV